MMFFRPKWKYAVANFPALKTSINIQVFRKPICKSALFKWFGAKNRTKPAIHAGSSVNKGFHPSLLSIEQLLDLPAVRILNVEVSKREIRCDLESTRGFAICHRCGEKATKFFEHGETLSLRHLPICELKVM